MAADMLTVAQDGLDCERRWELRINRARGWGERDRALAAVLRFYGMVLEFQRDLARISKSSFIPGVALREQIDLKLASSRMPALLSLAVTYASQALAQEANRLLQSGEASWHGLLKSALVVGEPELGETDAFFARACLQPMAENLQSQLPGNVNYSKSVCPACGGLPQASVLRPEGDGARRWLLCSFCLREWIFRRVVCPWCGEEDKEKLPRYSAEECAHVRVEGCDTCKRYLKAVDMTIDGRAVPLVDEVALAVLDVWAVDRGYTKITRNFMGF